MTTKCLHGHDKVCANMIQLNFFFIKSAKNILVWFLIKKILVFHHILKENRL